MMAFASHTLNRHRVAHPRWSSSPKSRVRGRYHGFVKDAEIRVLYGYLGLIITISSSIHDLQKDIISVSPSLLSVYCPLCWKAWKRREKKGGKGLARQKLLINFLPVPTRHVRSACSWLSLCLTQFSNFCWCRHSYFAICGYFLFLVSRTSIQVSTPQGCISGFALQGDPPWRYGVVGLVLLFNRWPSSSNGNNHLYVYMARSTWLSDPFASLCSFLFVGFVEFSETTSIQSLLSNSHCACYSVLPLQAAHLLLNRGWKWLLLWPDVTLTLLAAGIRACLKIIAGNEALSTQEWHSSLGLTRGT